MYECFHCGCRSVVWSADFDSEDYGYEEPGIIHECHCVNCGAQIDNSEILQQIMVFVVAFCWGFTGYAEGIIDENKYGKHK